MWTSPTMTAPRRSKSARRGEPESKRSLTVAASVTRLIPTSMTVAPGLTNDGVTKPARPIAAAPLID